MGGAVKVIRGDAFRIISSSSGTSLFLICWSVCSSSSISELDASEEVGVWYSSESTSGTCAASQASRYSLDKSGRFRSNCARSGSSSPRYGNKSSFHC